MTSKISWTNETWEPFLGCSRVSTGCEGCYAERLTARMDTNPTFKGKYADLTRATTKGPRWTGVVRVDRDALRKPLYWKRPRRIFVNSRSDTFHESLTDEQIDLVFAVMYAAQWFGDEEKGIFEWHTFQVLTKRTERMQRYLSDPAAPKRWARTGVTLGVFGEDPDLLHDSLYYSKFGPQEIMENLLPRVWLGTSIEDQKSADERISHLVKTPAAIRFLSCEPLLGPVDLERWFAYHDSNGEPYGRRCGPDGLPFINWVIVGGESGPKAKRRPMKMEWARELRNQCYEAGVAFYFKQDSGRFSNERPYIIEEDGKAFRWHQFPGELSEPEEVQP